jgi:WD repeat-containing protein mio
MKHLRYPSDSRQTLEPSKQKLSPYDLSGQGVFGIWEGGPATSAPRRPVEPISASSVAGSKSITDHVRSASGDGRSSSKSRDLVSSSRRGSRLLLDPNPLSITSAVQEDDYTAALNALCLMAGDSGGRWKPSTPTSKTAQRRMCLQLVGWSLREEELNNAVSR